LSSIRSLLLVIVLFCALGFGYVRWRDASSQRQLAESAVPEIDKQPVAFANRTFDPAAPPADMPSLSNGENAACESNFAANADVGGETGSTDATHGTVTITKIKVTLQANINIWTPPDVTTHVMEHEQGHRQIAEFYYQSADKIAARIAATYMGKHAEITGADLNAESNKWLEKMASEIAAEYNRELDPQPTQLLYDSITDHSRNGVVAADAVAHALKNVSIESLPSSSKADSENRIWAASFRWRGIDQPDLSVQSLWNDYCEEASFCGGWGAGAPIPKSYTRVSISFLSSGI
jgi:hypothetical protein